MNKFIVQTINESGLTLADIARKMGITPQAVNNLTRTAEPRPSTLIKLLSALDWSMAEIEALPLGQVYELAAPPTANGGS